MIKIEKIYFMLGEDAVRLGKYLNSNELFKGINAEKMAARELLRWYLPSAVKNLLDLSNIEIVSTEFIDKDLFKKMCDILIQSPPQVQRCGQEIRLYPGRAPVD